MSDVKKSALEDIGFYTLTDARATSASGTSPMWRCEMILTGRCNFRCPYCRGTESISRDCSADMPVASAMHTIGLWIKGGLKNIRFSGGEPMLYPHLLDLVAACKSGGVHRIAVSTNGSDSMQAYHALVEAGVNDFSVSLDACCASFGDKMSAAPGHWPTVAANIRKLSEIAYVTVGVVLTPANVAQTAEIVAFAHSLGVADIRVISAAQFNMMPDRVDGIANEVLDVHPILRYRVQHLREGRGVRGIEEYDSPICRLVQDDSIVAGKWHFPCVIYMREGGEPIGEVGPGMREERVKWSRTHDSFRDPVCRNNCLDVCVDYNNRCHALQKSHCGAATKEDTCPT